MIWAPSTRFLRSSRHVVLRRAFSLVGEVVALMYALKAASVAQATASLNPECQNAKSSKNCVRLVAVSETKRREIPIMNIRTNRDAKEKRRSY